MFGRDTELVTRRQALRILLIENDAGYASALHSMLTHASETPGGVVTVTSLAEAMEQIGKEQFGVILLEFFLPDGAGLANITLLQEAAPHVPVIVLGAADDEAVAVEAVHAGAQDYLAKSQINANSLLRSIRYTIERHEADLALVRAEERYHSIFDHLVEGIFQTTPDGHYLLANAALARIYGYASPEELMASITDIGDTLYAQPGRREEFQRNMDEHDTITDFESQIYRKDGTVIWISENCRAIRDDQGRLRYYEGTVTDITQRREAEAKLRHSEGLYHSLVETLPQNIFRKDLQERFTFANQQFCRTLGRELKDILGRTDFDFFPVEMATKYQQDDRSVLDTGKPLEAVEEHRPPGGGRLYVQVVKTPLRGAYGQIIGLQGIFWDITTQKLAEERVRQAQESLRESEALYHSLVDTMPQSIFRMDLEGRYTFANKQFCKMANRPADQLLGRSLFDILPEALAGSIHDDNLRVMQSGQVHEQIEENKFNTAEPGYLHVLKIPIFDLNGRVIGLQGLLWDITAQQLAEKRIRQANAELAESREQLRVRNVQMEDDLKMAREIQITMLPQQYPVLPSGVQADQSAFHFTHRYHPSGTVGGDFFSVAPVSDTEVAVFICDVAGHGVRSALVTAMIRALVEELRPVAHDPGQFMTKLNSELFAILKHAGSPVLTTAFYFVASSTTGQMQYSNAGHPKPLLLRRSAKVVQQLKNKSQKSQPALGLFEKSAYETSELKLAAQDLLMLFTDGLYEVHSVKDEIYSQDRLAASVAQQLHLPAAGLFDSVLREIREFSASHEFDDDVCLVGIEFSGTTPGNSR